MQFLHLTEDSFTLFSRKLINIDRNLIHINLAIAIAISNALFIVADSVYKYKVKYMVIFISSNCE